MSISIYEYYKIINYKSTIFGENFDQMINLLKAVRKKYLVNLKHISFGKIFIKSSFSELIVTKIMFVNF